MYSHVPLLSCFLCGQSAFAAVTSLMFWCNHAHYLQELLLKQVQYILLGILCPIIALRGEGNEQGLASIIKAPLT